MQTQTRADGDGSPRTHTVTADAGGATPEHSPACAGPDLGTPGIPQLVLAVLLERGA